MNFSAMTKKPNGKRRLRSSTRSPFVDRPPGRISSGRANSLPGWAIIPFTSSGL